MRLPDRALIIKNILLTRSLLFTMPYAHKSFTHEAISMSQNVFFTKLVQKFFLKFHDFYITISYTNNYFKKFYDYSTILSSTWISCTISSTQQFGFEKHALNVLIDLDYQFSLDYQSNFSFRMFSSINFILAHMSNSILF